MIVWQSTSLQHYTGYSEETLAPVMQAVVRTLEKVTEQCKVRPILNSSAETSGLKDIVCISLLMAL